MTRARLHVLVDADSDGVAEGVGPLLLREVPREKLRRHGIIILTILITVHSARRIPAPTRQQHHNHGGSSRSRRSRRSRSSIATTVIIIIIVNVLRYHCYNVNIAPSAHRLHRHRHRHQQHHHHCNLHLLLLLLLLLLSLVIKISSSSPSSPSSPGVARILASPPSPLLPSRGGVSPWGQQWRCRPRMALRESLHRHHCNNDKSPLQ